MNLSTDAPGILSTFPKCRCPILREILHHSKAFHCFPKPINTLRKALFSGAMDLTKLGKKIKHRLIFLLRKLYLQKTAVHIKNNKFNFSPMTCIAAHSKLSMPCQASLKIRCDMFIIHLHIISHIYVITGTLRPHSNMLFI